MLNKNLLQERALQLVDKTEGDFEITEGISLVQSEEPSQARSLNEITLSDDQETREQEVESLLVDRVARFVGSHTLQFKVPKDSIKDVQRSLEEGKQFLFSTPRRLEFCKSRLVNVKACRDYFLDNSISFQ